MNIRDLEYLVALAEHRHFRRAADSCHVSQPTLSGQIRKLEDELGVMLLERTSRKVLFTLEVTARFESFSTRITKANVNFCGSPGSAFFCHKKARR